jgi:hypothetical protein
MKKNKSKFNYRTAGGYYLPTVNQYLYCTLIRYQLNVEQKEAVQQVINGFTNRIKIHHDYIHIVNEMRRTRFI